MRNFKYLCLLFAILTASRINCIPIDEKKCSIPPELVISFGIESIELNDIKNCRDDEQDIKYCQEIQHLVSDISNCNLVKLWDIKELKEKISRSSKEILIDDKIDICLNFGNLMKIITMTGEKSIGVQLTMDRNICEEFCDIQPKICPLLLKLYWIRHVLMELGHNEISKPNKPSKTLPPQKDEKPPPDSVPLLEHNTSPKKLQTQKVPLMPAEKLNPDTKVIVTEASKTDKSETVGKVSNTKSYPINKNLPSIINAPTSAKHTIPSPTNEVDPKLTTISKNTNDQTTQPELNPSNNQHIKDDKLAANAITDSDLKTKITTNIANKNLVSTDDIDKNIKKEVSKSTDGSSDNRVNNEIENKLPPDDKQTIQSNPIKDIPSESENGLNQESEKTDKISTDEVDKNVKKEVSKSADGSSDKTVINKIENKLPPDDKQTVQSNTIKDIPSESENGLNQESQKTDKNYADDDLSSTVNAGKVETKVELDKKHEISTSKDNRMGSGFPEEEDSHFFAYFLTIIVLCIAGYLVFHNKQKIIALIIEGRHERRRRPNGGYKRLDSKDSSKSTSQVIF